MQVRHLYIPEEAKTKVTNHETVEGSKAEQPTYAAVHISLNVCQTLLHEETWCRSEHMEIDHLHYAFG